MSNRRATGEHIQEHKEHKEQKIKGKTPPKKQTDSRHTTFRNWWFEKYEYKFGKPYIVTNWKQAGAQINSLLRLPFSFEDLQYLAIEFFLDKDPFITGSDNGSGAGHNLGMFLARINQNCYKKYLDPEFRRKKERHILKDTGMPRPRESAHPDVDGSTEQRKAQEEKKQTPPSPERTDNRENSARETGSINQRQTSGPHCPQCKQMVPALFDDGLCEECHYSRVRGLFEQIKRSQANKASRDGQEK